ncbi:hypothetical protein MANES_12G021100v8 [Manihot esculenta]|uniref:Uncharacterized protein n=1 Tax=Manihot esculenta TaxID=3983 RepID=A0ACB7GPT8_MANES|nr:hypothetical protein MANES_12G021100v8 [Manihot esculenta]
MESVRLRLVFGHILSKSHETEGLKRCWILLKPQLQTISDLSSYLLHVFDLQNDCPRGLILSMEGFALPPFESISILKDKDIIRVEKNGGISSELLMVGDKANSLEVLEIVETRPVAAGMNLLAKEEFEKEAGGYRSEDEEDTPEQAEDAVEVGNAREVQKVSKKRKASKELKSSKRKKTKSTSGKKGAIVEDIGNNVCEEQNGTSGTAMDDERIENIKALPVGKRLSQPQQNGNGTASATPTSSGTKKLPSRSARRKKAKRQWLKEKLKAERKEETFQWNGTTSKKKGQKWGKEKVPSYKRNDYKNVNQECSRTQIYGARPISTHIDFEKLEFYASLPKEGDVIAYRLIELSSSSWTPELSSYRAGKISRYDIETNRVWLVPVPEYPMIPVKEIGDDSSAEPSETSSYARDGSLWIEFSSLVEVRLVTLGNLNSGKSIGVSVRGQYTDTDTETGAKSNNGSEAHASDRENGEVNAWEEINQALNAKKEQLSEEDNWNKTPGSGRRPWSYKAMRGSALGPTVALLRAQNEL